MKDMAHKSQEHPGNHILFIVLGLIMSFIIVVGISFFVQEKAREEQFRAAEHKAAVEAAQAKQEAETKRKEEAKQNLDKCIAEVNRAFNDGLTHVDAKKVGNTAYLQYVQIGMQMRDSQVKECERQYAQPSS